MRPLPLLSLSLVALVGGLALTGRAGVAMQETPTTRPATQPASAEGLDDEQLAHARRPISYFNRNCGNCHGNYGSFWGEGFIEGLSDEQLHEIVDEMAAGPGFAPLKKLPLEVQVAYHRSLLDEKPFLTVYIEEGRFRGEVTPGSKVVLEADDETVEATVNKHAWQTPAGLDASKVKAVRAVNGEAATRLDVPGRLTEAQGLLYSHQAPLQTDGDDGER